MLSLPLITPRDSHELWFGSSQPHRSSFHYHQNAGETNNHSRRNNGSAAHLNSRTLISSTIPANGLSALLLEERALRARKQNIASFGYSWIKPAGCTKTMLGMKEEEAEREEAMAAAAAEMAATAADPSFMDGPQMDMDGQNDQIMERDLDDYIPEADGEGLVEEGEEGLEEDYNEDDEDGFMDRDLDDDIPEGFQDDDGENDESVADDGFDDQPDLDDDIPEADDNDEDEDGDDDDDGDNGMARDLDEDIPEAAEAASEEDEWQHTDTDAEIDDDGNEQDLSPRDLFAENLRASTSSSVGLPQLPSQLQTRRNQNSRAHRPFLPRWSGSSGTDAFNSSGMMLDEEDLRASITSTGSRQSIFSRRFPRRFGGPRDSLE